MLTARAGSERSGVGFALQKASAVRERGVLADTLLSTTHEICFSNQRLLVQSRQRIALSRRLLNPGWALEEGSGDRDLSGATKLCVLSEDPMLLGVEREISGPGASVFACFGSYSAWWEENVRDAGRSRRRSQKQRALIQWSPTPVEPDPLRLTLIAEPFAGSSIRRTSAPPGSVSASEGAKRRPEEVDDPGSTIRSDGLGSVSLPCALLLSSLDVESLPAGAAYGPPS